MAKIAQDKTINCEGLTCPEPILQTTLTLTKMETGQILLMSSTDPLSVNDMRAWSIQTGHKILKEEKDGNLYKFYIQKSDEKK